MRHSFRWWEAFWKWLLEWTATVDCKWWGYDVDAILKDGYKEFEEITRTIPRWWEKKPEELTLPPKPRKEVK